MCGFYYLVEVSYVSWLVVLVGVQVRGVVDIVYGDQFFCFGYCVFEIFCMVYSQCWRQFFVSKWFVFVNVGYFINQNFGGGWYGEVCQFSDFGCWLINDSCVQCVIFQDNVLNGFQFFILQQIVVVVGEMFVNCVID